MEKIDRTEAAERLYEAAKGFRELHRVFTSAALSINNLPEDLLADMLYTAKELDKRALEIQIEQEQTRGYES